MENARRPPFPLYSAALQVLQLVKDFGVYMSSSSGELYIGAARVVMTEENRWISPMIETLDAFRLCVNENSYVRLTPEGLSFLMAHLGESVECRAISCVGQNSVRLGDGRTFVVGDQPLATPSVT